MYRSYRDYLKLIPVMVIAVIIFKLINETEVLMNVYRFTLTLISPIIWAIVIAYLLNPLLKLVQKYLKLNRLCGVLLIYTLVIVMLSGLVLIIVPTTVNSITDIINQFPTYMETANRWFGDRLKDIQSLERFINTYNISLDALLPESIPEQLTDMTNSIQQLVMSMGRTLFDFTSGIFKFVMGLILSLYILLDKENHAKHVKRLARAFLGEARAKSVMSFVAEVDLVFGKYLIGKTIDSIIIGIMCYVGLFLLGARYAMLFAIIVGITNMIPYFGPIIGAVPVIVVTLFYSPIQSLWVAIFMLVLQQFDGNILAPMILGDRVGMSPLWVIVAIIFGGGLFGVAGMLLGVPTAAVLRNIVDRHVNRVLADETRASE